MYVIVVLTLKFYNLLKQKTKNKTGCVDLIKSNYYEIEVLNSIIFNPKKAGKKSLNDYGVKFNIIQLILISI